MKLEIGMYVRTKNGKIWTINSQQAISGHRKDIINASYNIIDLIEVGDYVNGEKVMLNNDGNIKIGTTRDNIVFNNEKFIKSIVTKEQFESMSYYLYRRVNK